MTKKPSKPSKDRVVYEVKGPKGTQQIEATTTAELKMALAPLLNIEPYSLQATAHITHAERGAVQGQGWSVRRLGVLSFVPDQHSVINSATQKPARVSVGQVQEGNVGGTSESPSSTERPQTLESTASPQPRNVEIDQMLSHLSPTPVIPKE